MENVTFETLPKAVTDVQNVVNHILRLLREQGINTQPEPDRWFNINELIQYLPDKPAKPTVYGWVAEKRIPCHKGGKSLRFLKSEIDGWLMLGRRKTIQELQLEAKKKGLKHE